MICMELAVLVNHNDTKAAWGDYTAYFQYATQPLHHPVVGKIFIII